LLLNMSRGKFHKKRLVQSAIKTQLFIRGAGRYIGSALCVVTVKQVSGAPVVRAKTETLDQPIRTDATVRPEMPFSSLRVAL
jgi:hypothetical protein